MLAAELQKTAILWVEHGASSKIVFNLVIPSSLLLRFHMPAFLQSACLLSADYSEELCFHRSTFHGLVWHGLVQVTAHEVFETL